MRKILALMIGCMILGSCRPHTGQIVPSPVQPSLPLSFTQDQSASAELWVSTQVGQIHLHHPGHTMSVTVDGLYSIWGTSYDQSRLLIGERLDETGSKGYLHWLDLSSGTISERLPFAPIDRVVRSPTGDDWLLIKDSCRILLWNGSAAPTTLYDEEPGFDFTNVGWLADSSFAYFSGLNRLINGHNKAWLLDLSSQQVTLIGESNISTVEVVGWRDAMRLVLAFGYRSQVSWYEYDRSSRSMVRTGHEYFSFLTKSANGRWVLIGYRDHPYCELIDLVTNQRHRIDVSSVTEAVFLHNGHIGLEINAQWHVLSPEGLQPLPEAVRVVY